MRRISADEAERVYRAAGATPLVPYPGRNYQRWPGTCTTCGGPVSPTLKSLKRGQGACTACGKRRAAQLLTKPAREAEDIYRTAGATPSVPYPGRRHLPWPGTCNTCGAAVAPSVKDLRRGHGPCVPCGKAAAGRTRAMSEDRAREIYRKAGGIPNVPFPGRRDLPWPGRCIASGHPTAPSIDSLLLGRGCCRRCADENRKPRKDEQEAIAVYRAHGGEPTAPFPGMRKRWAGVCLRCAANVRPILHDTVHNGVSVCRTCNDRDKRLKRMLTYEQAEAIYREAGGIPDPAVPYPGTKNPWPGWCASCGADIAPRLNNLQQGAGPCTACVSYGFNRALPSVLYLMGDGREKLKIGVANETAFDRRKDAHARAWGAMWVYDVRRGSGYDVARWERRILELLDQAGIARGSDLWAPFDGYTETWHAQQLPVGSIDLLEEELLFRCSQLE